MGKSVRIRAAECVTLCLLSMVLNSCIATPPGSRLPAAGNPPGQWAATPQAQAGIDRNWIKKIGGPELQNLVDTAISGNSNLRAAAARVDRAAAQAQIAGAGRLPSLGLGLEGQRNKQNLIGFPFGGAGSDTLSNLSERFGVNLNAAWEVDLWGRLKAGHEAAIADAQARKYDYEAARVSLAAQVTKAWLALAEANEQITLAHEGLGSRKVLADAVRQRFERAIAEDGGSAAQVRLTESELAIGQGELAQRQQERERAVRQLEILLGSYPSGDLSVAAGLPPFPNQTPAGLPSELLLRRPDILAAERNLASAGRRLKEQRLAKFPSLNLTASGGTATESLGDILKSSFNVWSIGGNLTQPLFQGGRIQGGIDRARAEEREQIATLQDTVLNAFGEVEQALTAELYLRKREQAADRARRSAADAASRADEEFSGGTGNVLTLIDAKQREILTASQYVAIRRLRLENRVNLHIALAGDFRVTK